MLKKRLLDQSPDIPRLKHLSRRTEKDLAAVGGGTKKKQQREKRLIQ